MTLPLIIEPAELHAHLNRTDLLILDLSRAETYAQAHVPGAIFVDFKDTQLGIQPTPGALPLLAQLELLFSRVGLSADKHVVVYDDEGSGWAGRLIWIFDMIGHTRYSCLNGGIHAWLAEQLPVENTPATATPSDYKIATLHPEFAMEMDEIQARLGTDLQIWDARSAAEYKGEKIVGKHGGHIPGAKNYEWTRGMDNQRQLRIKPTDVLIAELNAAGIDLDKETVTHCQTHHRSGYTYLLGKHLGMNIKGFPGSWAQWGSSDSTPKEI